MGETMTTKVKSKVSKKVSKKPSNTDKKPSKKGTKVKKTSAPIIIPRDMLGDVLLSKVATLEKTEDNVVTGLTADNYAGLAVVSAILLALVMWVVL